MIQTPREKNCHWKYWLRQRYIIWVFIKFAMCIMHVHVHAANTDTSTGGWNHLFWLIIFSIRGHGKWFLKNCISFLWFEEIIVIGYNLVSFLNNCIENFSKYIYIIAKKIYFKNRFQYPYSFQYQSNIIRVIQIKKKRINFLFIAVLYFPLSIQMNILKLYNNCYVILTTYMLDWALRPLYNLSFITEIGGSYGK